MFIHGKTGKEYYSVREKIKYYKKRAFNDNTITAKQKKYALKRLSELSVIDKSDYREPTMIVTDDKHFGNKISKPRACVVVGQDIKKRLIVCPVHDRTVKTVILDNDHTRQVDYDSKRIDRSDVYEIKNIDGLLPLTDNDKKKLSLIHDKK